MKISAEIIEHVALLSHLNLDQEEKTRLLSDLEEILTHVEKLNQLDTRGVEPKEHVIPMFNVLREDQVSTSVNREELLANAPLREEGCFKVPKIVE